MDDEKIIKFPKKNESINNKDEQLLENILGSVGEALGDEDGFKAFASILSMPEEEFSIFAPMLIAELERGFNNPTDRVALVQAMNISGIRSEDLNETFEEICKQIDNQLVTMSQKKRDFIKELIGMICNTISDTEGIAKRYIKIPIELCNPDAKMPQYAHESDSGLDIFALEDIVIAPGETKLVKTGLKVAIPLGYELQVRPKSGRALKTKLRVANTPGTIDAGYRDEIGVIIESVEPPIKYIDYDFDEITHRPIIKAIETGSNQYIGKGEKFAQLVLQEVPKAVFYEVDNIEKVEGNRGGGFGSTGLK